MIAKASRLFRELAERFMRVRDPLGTLGAFEYVFVREGYRQVSKYGWTARGKLLSLHARDCPYPVRARYGSSDLDSFHQIFIQREYACLDTRATPRLIVDCGANVGYASLYYLNRYPRSQVIAIEPDEENFALCKKNLAPYRNRVVLMRSAVWSHPAGLRVIRGQYRDGREWATQVRECDNGESPDVYAVTVSEVLQDSRYPCIDILKIDIEGAEKVVFSTNVHRWLRKTRNMVVELHDKECETALFRALKGYEYACSRSGEFTVLRNIAPGAEFRDAR